MPKVFSFADEVIGRGSYGSVYVAQDENKDTIAVKCCGTQSINLVELAIMSSILHPNLNYSLGTFAAEEKLYIFQPIAMCDLGQHVNSNKHNHRPNIQEMKQWTFELCSAVGCLHENGIIHCDIKPENVLLYTDNTLKLSDFGLATFSSEKLDHQVCTITHRPPECLKKEIWNKPLDIWALGCTLYRVMYGELLFKYQGVIDLEQGLKKDTNFRQRLNSRSYNAIWHFFNKTLGEKRVRIDDAPHDLEFIGCLHPERFEHIDVIELNDFLMSMIKYHPEERSKIGDLLESKFLSNFKKISYSTSQCARNQISAQEKHRVTRYIQLLGYNSKINKLAFEYYTRATNMSNHREAIKAMAVVSIAVKMLLGKSPKFGIKQATEDRVFKAELDFYHSLKFKLILCC